MENKAKTPPPTNEERQAIGTVQAIHDVYGEILKLADLLKDSSRPAIQRNDAKHALSHASERLCNLMALSQYQLDNLPKHAVHERLTQELTEFRGRLVGLGSKLVVEKLEKLDQRAESVLQEKDYPIGLSGKLEIAYANLMDNLGVLGGADALGDKVSDLVAKTDADLKSLGEMEQKIGALDEIQSAKSRKR
jgi:hypothetical protein